MKIKTLSILLALFAMAPIVNADSITYIYNDGTFGPLPAGVPAGVTGVTGTFTVDLPVSNNDNSINFPLLDFLFSDGLNQYDPTNFDVLRSNFRTDASGGIVDFFLRFLDSSAVVGAPFGLVIAYDTDPVNFFGIQNTVQYCTLNNGNTCIGASNVRNNSIGSLSTAVPEPGTLTLFGIGLLGLGLARRKAA